MYRKPKEIWCGKLVFIIVNYTPVPAVITTISGNNVSVEKFDTFHTIATLGFDEIFDYFTGEDIILL